MAIANPLVLTYDGGSKTLVKINQDSYGSEYYLREATQDFRVRIRNTSESKSKDGVVYDRHNVEITQTVFSVTPGVPDKVIQTYVVVRNAKNAVAADVAKLGDALTVFLTNVHYQDLVAWAN